MVSLRIKTWNCRATFAATIPSIIGSILRITRSVSSLRTHQRIAVFVVIGSSPATRAETGVTAATGLAERMMNRPIVAFQKPMTDHGRVTANSTTRTKSTMPKPPAVRAKANSQTSPTIEAATIRLRPILMTSLATVIGLLPMALKLGEGSESYAPLAQALIGGLTLSVLLTVFLVPAGFFLVYRPKVQG